MDNHLNMDLALIELRLLLLEEILLRSKETKNQYIERLDLLRFLFEKEAGESKDLLIQKIDKHLATIKTFPTQ